MKELNIMDVFSGGVAAGLKNAASLLGALVLYVLTCWIPYLNVGTTIALSCIPIELSKGNVISPLFIFDEKYRKFMGEYFNLMGLKFMSLFPAYLFMIVPGVVISLGWSLALYIMIDKAKNPSEALMESSKATDGSKWTIFGIKFLLYFAMGVLVAIFNYLGTFGYILTILTILCTVVINYGLTAVIYKKLVD